MQLIYYIYSTFIQLFLYSLFAITWILMKISLQCCNRHFFAV